jgi:hypothetical protein
LVVERLVVEVVHIEVVGVAKQGAALGGSREDSAQTTFDANLTRSTFISTAS